MCEADPTSNDSSRRVSPWVAFSLTYPTHCNIFIYTNGSQTMLRRLPVGLKLPQVVFDNNVSWYTQPLYFPSGSVCVVSELN